MVGEREAEKEFWAGHGLKLADQKYKARSINLLPLILGKRCLRQAVRKSKRP
jgi:hypothetical protein